MNIQDDYAQEDITEMGVIAGDPSAPEAWELEDFSDLVPLDLG